MPNRLSQEIAPHLPYLRRYARALTGSQQSGDAHVTACLDALVADAEVIDLGDGPKVGLYRLFHEIWTGLEKLDAPEDGADSMERTVQERLSGMTAEGRQVLLLTTLEGFPAPDAAKITGHSPEEVERLIARGGRRDRRADRHRRADHRGRAGDRRSTSRAGRELGHPVTSAARTAEGGRRRRAQTPGLVLADIQLADGSSGIDAVQGHPRPFDVPVIFVTAFPERLLTGERPEPTFLITKPFQPEAVKAAIGQALFFRTSASVEA